MDVSMILKWTGMDLTYQNTKTAQANFIDNKKWYT